MKGGGSLPTEMAETIAPTAEILPLYMREMQRVLAAGAAAGADQFVAVAALMVPFGEIWVVNNITAQVSNVGAATSVWLQPAYVRKGPQSNVFVPATSPVQVPVNGDGLQGWPFGFMDLVMYPGDQPGCVFSNGVYGVNITPTITVDYYRLEI